MRDPFLREIVQNALAGITEEAGIFGARSAYSPFVNEMPEIASAVFDAKARLLAMGEGGMTHISAVKVFLPEVLKDCPPETLVDGDALICNDPFRGGIHPTDVAVFVPIFCKGRLAFFFGGMLIVSDLGGMSTGGLPATATETFHEGLAIPPLKLYEAGVPNADVHRIIQANSRTPERVIGDIRALVAAGNMAKARLMELTDKYGYEVVEEILEEVLNHSERITRHAIEQIPDGVYKGAYVVEQDGVDPSIQSYKIVVTVTIDGSNCKMDFTGTDAQARGCINSSYSQSLSGAAFAIRCLLDANVPFNEGFYRPLELALPLGSIVNPRYPAACNMRMGTVQAMMDAITEALSPVCPDKATAAAGACHVFTLSGRDPETNQMWGLMDTQYSSMGGRSSKDGGDALPHLFYGYSGYGRNVEAFEWEYPVLYHYFRFVPDSAGPGKWRGGAGMVRELEFLSQAELTVRANGRCEIPPRGFAGGKAGMGGGWIQNRGCEDEKVLPIRATNLPVHKGDTLTELVSGGGGYGDPLARDPQMVAKDVRIGLVSIEGAARDYGIVIDAATGLVDAAATRQLRQRVKV